VTRRAVTLLVALAALAGAGSAAAGGYTVRHVDASSFPTIRVVVEGRGASAPTLRENGGPVQLASRENLGASKALVVAIDRSQSMRVRPLADAVAAAGELLARKRPADELAVVSFASHAEADTGFSQATIDGETALRALSTDPVPGTALYDAVVLACRELARQPLPGRVLVLLTDGVDVGSTATLADAVAAAHRAGVVVQTIGVGDADRAALRRLASQTAGTFYASPTTASLRSIYRRIAGELDNTWALSYVTASRPGANVAIAVDGGRALAVRLPGTSASPAAGGPHLFTTLGGAVLVSALAGLALFGVLLLVQWTPRAARMRQRVWEHTELKEPPRRKRPLRRRLPTLHTLLGALDTRLRNLPWWTGMSALVERAGLPVPPAAAVVASGALALLLFFVGLASDGAVLGLLMLVLGLMLPFVGLRLLAARRVRAFDNQLPDLLATIASTLRAGHGLRAALQSVADDGAPPASVELRRVLAEARLGRPLDEALVSMCERLGWDDLLYVATAVQVQSQVGGSLAGVFTTVADTVRRRQQHRRRIRALTATGRSAATILTVLPFVFAGLITLINPNYMLPFLRSHHGHVLLVLCLISISIGAVALNRIVNVKA